MFRGFSKCAVIACILSSGVSAFAEYTPGFKANVVAQNFALFRGLDFSHIPTEGQLGATGGGNNGAGPGIGGGMQYFHESGVSVGAYTMNLRYPFIQEAHHWIAYTYQIDKDFSVTGTVYRRWFPKANQYSRMDYQVQANWKTLTFHVSYMPKYFYGPGFDGTQGKESSDLYIMANYAHPITENVFAVVELGSSNFSDEKYVGMKSYLNYYAGIRHTKDDLTVDLGWSETNRKEFDNGPNAIGGPTSKAKDGQPWLKGTMNF